MQEQEGISDEYTDGTGFIDRDPDIKWSILTVSTATVAKIVSPLVSLFNLYQIPTFKNGLNLGASYTNIAAYTHGSNFYLLSASFLLMAGRTFEVITEGIYEGNLKLVAEQIVSHILFFQTPQAVHTYFSDITLDYIKLAYLAYHFYTNIELNYEYNYGSKYLEHKKESYDLWNKHMKTIGYYTNLLGDGIYNAMTSISLWSTGQSQDFSTQSTIIGTKIEDIKRDKFHESWLKCKDMWSSHFNIQEIGEICKRDEKFQNCMQQHYLKYKKYTFRTCERDEKFQNCMSERHSKYPKYAFETCKKDETFQDCMSQYYIKYQDEAFEKLCTMSSKELEAYIAKVETQDRCISSNIYKGREDVLEGCELLT